MIKRNLSNRSGRYIRHVTLDEFRSVLMESVSGIDDIKIAKTVATMLCHMEGLIIDGRQSKGQCNE